MTSETISPVPNQPKTPMRSMRIDDETWARVVKLAEQDGITYSDVIRRALDHYLDSKGAQR